MARTQNSNAPLSIWQANFDTGVGVGRASNWYDLTDRVLSWNHKVGKQHESGLSEAGMGSVVLQDRLEYLNPANTGSPYNVGGNSLKPYRQIRHAEMWPLAGNILNSTNDVWGAPYGFSGSYADSSSFESGTIGNWFWTGISPPVNSTTRAHDGTHSMQVTWSAHTGAGAPGTVAANLLGLPMRTGYTYTLSMWIWIVSGPAVTIRCNGATATSTSTTGAWQRVSVTFVAADQAGEQISAYPSGTTTAGQNCFIDSVQLEVAGSASTYTTSGPTIYPMWWGYIERYPKTWRYAGFDGLCSLTIVDDLALANRMPLDSGLVSQILVDNPYWYWKIDENLGTFVALSQSQPIVGIVNYGSSPYSPRWMQGGSGGSTNTFGDNTSPDLDDQSSFRCNSTPGNGTPVNILWDTSFAPGGGATGSVTWTLCFKMIDDSQSQGLFRLKAGAGFQSSMRFLNIAGAYGLEYRTNFAASGVNITGGWADGEWHHVAVTLTNNGTTTTHNVYVDGIFLLTTPVTESTLPLYTGMDLAVSLTGDTLNGNLAHVAAYTSALSASEILLQAQAALGQKSFLGQTPGGRMSWLASLSGWPMPVNFPNGVGGSGSVVGLKGSTFSNQLDVLAISDGGIVYAAPEGRLTFIPRSSYYSQSSSSLTFGDDPVGSGDTPYRDGSLQIELDPTYIYNASLVSNKSGGTVYGATSTSSHNDYENSSISITIDSVDSTRVSSLASYAILLYQDGHLRAPSISFNIGANTSIISSLLGRRIGDRVTVRRRAPSFTTILDFFIESMSWSSTPETGILVSMILEPIHPFQGGIIGTGLIGTLLSTY